MELFSNSDNLILRLYRKINSHYWIMFSIITLVYLLNYSFGTTLIGWDNLQVELNPIVNIQKNWGSVWQEYQGLGFVAGNAHAVEFLRSILVLLLTIVLPDSIVRYFIHYIFILVGVLSAYALFKNLRINKDASFLGALFYFFNIGTVQNFYVPFEPFSAFFAFLPLCLLFIHKFLTAPKINKKITVSFITILLLLTFAFQVPTLFIVFSLILVVITFVRILATGFKPQVTSREVLSNIYRLSAIWVAYITVNLFWLLPFLYSLARNINVRSESLTTRLSTENVIYQGLSYANLADIALLRGFWYSNIDYLPKTESFGYMLQPWISWFDNPLISIIGYLLAILVFAGVYISFRKRKLGLYIFLPVLCLGIFFFFGSNGLTGKLFDLLVKILPPLGEAFRFAFTKWITPLCLAFAFFFAESVEFAFERFKQSQSKKIMSKTLTVIFAGLLFYYTWPYFTGNLFYKYNKFTIPHEYTQTMEFFNKDESIAEKRIALLPINAIWGWYFTDWNYRGSGFIWYGIPQAVLSRTFDVWSLKNEQLYHELQYALYSENPELLNFVLNKYQIDYLLIDENIIMPNADRSLFFKETKELLAKIDNVKLETEFGDSIYIYKVDLSEPVNKYVYAPDSYELVGSSFKFSNVDSSFITNDNNIEIYDAKSLNQSVIYPFADDKALADQLIDGSKISVANPYSGQKVLKIPTFIEGNKFLIKADYLLNSAVSIKYLFPQVFSKNKLIFSADESSVHPIGISTGTEYGILVGNEVLDISNPSVNTYIESGDNIAVFDFKPFSVLNVGEYVYSSQFYDCAGASGGKDTGDYPDSIKIFSNDQPACVRFQIPIVSDPTKIYKVSFEYKVLDGGSIHYCLRNKESKCVNEGVAKSTAVSDKYTKYVDYLNLSNTDTLSFELILEVEDDMLDYYEASFRNISIETHDIISSIPINSPISVRPDGYEIPLSDKDFPLQVVLPDVSSSKFEYKPNSVFYNLEARNCNQFKQTDFGRNFNDKDGSYEYYATDAISCDNIKSEFINPLNSYLISFDSKNIAGKGLDICIVGHNFDKCLIQDRLNGTGKESFILPSYPAANRVGIHIENQSIGNYEAKNILYGVTAKRIPYDWLKAVSIVPAEGIKEHTNSILVDSVEKNSTYKYKVLTSSRPTNGFSADSKLIVLNQSYEQGWGLYDAESCFLSLETPFTCSRVDAKHVMAKNWANAWIISGENPELLIIFWPQYLQFGGYLVLVILGIILLSLGRNAYQKHEKPQELEAF